MKADPGQFNLCLVDLVTSMSVNMGVAYLRDSSCWKALAKLSSNFPGLTVLFLFKWFSMSCSLDLFLKAFRDLISVTQISKNSKSLVLQSCKVLNLPLIVGP